jgi:hypothetical protein
MQVQWLGRQPYDGIEARMRAFTEARGPETPDELWMVEHDPVFTQGVGGRAEHLLMPGDIPVVRTQRGGQVTFHGPGQVVAYPLVDLRRLGIFVKEYVFRLEAAVLQVLQAYDVTGHRIRTAPQPFWRYRPGTHRDNPPDRPRPRLDLPRYIHMPRVRSWRDLQDRDQVRRERRLHPCRYPTSRTPRCLEGSLRYPSGTGQHSSRLHPHPGLNPQLRTHTHRDRPSQSRSGTGRCSLRPDLHRYRYREHRIHTRQV